MGNPGDSYTRKASFWGRGDAERKTGHSLDKMSPGHLLPMKGGYPNKREKFRQISPVTCQRLRQSRSGFHTKKKKGIFRASSQKRKIGGAGS